MNDKQMDALAEALVSILKDKDWFCCVCHGDHPSDFCLVLPL